MPSVPRITRAIPSGPIHRPVTGLPVIARLRWHVGLGDQDVPATALAWTREAVQIQWELEPGQPLHVDWIPAADVRRTVAEPPPGPSRPPTTVRGEPSRGGLRPGPGSRPAGPGPAAGPR